MICLLSHVEQNLASSLHKINQPKTKVDEISFKAVIIPTYSVSIRLYELLFKSEVNIVDGLVALARMRPVCCFSRKSS